MKWVKCKDERPEKNVLVIICLNNGKYKLGMWAGDEFGFVNEMGYYLHRYPMDFESEYCPYAWLAFPPCGKII
jgi:hypothetical protein